MRWVTPVGRRRYGHVGGLSLSSRYGAQVGALPPSRLYRPSAGAGTLQETNRSRIAKYGPRSLTINIKLCRTFQLVFVIADVDHPILGSGFSKISTWTSCPTPFPVRFIHHARSSRSHVTVSDNGHTHPTANNFIKEHLLRRSFLASPNHVISWSHHSITSNTTF